jgi:TonB-linked SusC/RagA family outer membrane protein
MSTKRWLRAVLGAGAVFALVSAIARPLSGQATGTIRGTVRNAEDNAPIGRARISIEALRMAALTNEDGRYELRNVPAGPQSVAVRFIGFRAEIREVLSNPGQTTVADFQMRAQALMMSEVVITGVSEATSRAKLPFTVAKVTTDAIPVPPTVALGSIKGKVAGVNLITGTQPGEGSSIVLRSPTSIFKESSPLIVVDGAILTESSVDVSSLDIESVEVIKGAAAASLYGSRAGSGVIQIRTNRGSQIQEGRTRLIVRSEYGTNAIMRPIEWARYHNLRMNATQTAYQTSGGLDTLARQYAAPSRFLFQDQPYPTPTYDHIANLFDPGQYMTNSLSIGHNSGTTSWLATASQHKTAGVVKENDGYGRYDFKVNLDHRVTNDLSVSLSAFHMDSKQEDAGGNPFFDFIHQAPDVDLLQPDPDGTPYMFQPDPLGIRANPLYQMATQEHWDYRGRTVGSMDLRFNPWPWLGVTANGSYDRSDRRSEDWIPRGVKTPESPTGSVGSSNLFTGQTEGINASAGLTVTRAFGDLETRTAARVLVEHQDNKTVTANADVALVGGIPDLDAFSTLENTSLEERVRSRGYYLTTDLDYGERYIISALARRDGSSLFGSEQRWHWYYRASGAWRMSAETWWPFPNALSEFKLRYSRGTAGGRPDFADRFEVFNLGTSGISLGTLGNVFLKPEKTTEQEFGIDAVAFERFSLNLSYAKQRTVDQLIEVPLPALYGFEAQWQNAGTIEGHTYEATLDGHLIETDKVRWGVTLIADRSRNQLVAYGRPCHAEGLLGNRCEGQVLGEMWGQRLWQSYADLPAVHANSQDAFDINDDGLVVPVGVGNTYQNGVTGGVTDSLWGTNVSIDGINYAWGMPQRVLSATGQPDRILIGDANPDMNWGLSSQLRVGQLNIYALIGGQIGGDVYNSTKQRMYQYSRHREEDQDGKPEELKKPSSYYTGALYNGNLASQWFVEDGTYTKLREVSVRFALTPRQLPALQRLGMDRVMLALIGRNLHEWTNYSGYDAEVGNVIERRDNFGFPTYRTFTFSLEIEF